MEERGLAFDRRFIVARPDGQFVSARTHPRLLLIHSALLADGLHLRAPAMPALDLHYAEFDPGYTALSIWGDALQGQHCGQAADAWCSQYLGEPLQLLYLGPKTQRQRVSLPGFAEGELSFADGYPPAVDLPGIAG